MGKERTEKLKKDDYKHWFDFTILIVSHLLLLPLWLLIWIVVPSLVWLGDRGPVFYLQERVGKNNKIFTIYKFRTMVLDAELKGPPWTTESDPRVTKVGKILRRTALDELPGLLSIWKGNMSFVGPRALQVNEQRILEQEIPGFENRLRSLPGLTGLSQVQNTTDDAVEKFRYDLEYLERMGPWLDTKLLCRSVWYTLAGKWDRRSGKPPQS